MLHIDVGYHLVAEDRWAWAVLLCLCPEFILRVDVILQEEILRCVKLVTNT